MCVESAAGWGGARLARINGSRLNSEGTVAPMAVYLALRDQDAEQSPKCMSFTVGKSIIETGRIVPRLVRKLRLSDKWQRLLEKRKTRWVNLAVSSIGRAIDVLGSDEEEGAIYSVTLKTGQSVQCMAPTCGPMHDDDLLELRRAASLIAAKPWEIALRVESVAEAVRAVTPAGVEWNAIDPIRLLRRMVDASERSS